MTVSKVTMIATFVLCVAAPLRGEDIDPTPPERVVILPIFFVPKGERPPTNDHKLRLMKHLKWAQDWYRGVLRGRDTFRIARSVPSVIPGNHDLAFYKQQIEGGSPQFVSEDGGFRNVIEKPVDKIDAQVAFPATRGQAWRLSLRAGPSKVVVVRGLQFFNESGEIFPPMVPYDGP